MWKMYNIVTKYL